MTRCWNWYTDDPLNAWEDIPVLELSGPLGGRVDAILAALDQTRRPRLRGPVTNAATNPDTQ